MPLSDEQEQREHKLKVDLMAADIDLKKAQTRKSEQDWRLDPQRVVISAFVAGAALTGAIIGVATVLLRTLGKGG